MIKKTHLATCVATLQPGEQWLFPLLAAKEGRTVNLDKPFCRCVLAAVLDVKQVVRHTLRHTAITYLVHAGVDLPTVKRISGHKNLSIFEGYVVRTARTFKRRWTSYRNGTN